MNVSEPKNEVKIRAEHVDFSYENTQTLFDINLEFRNHEVTALIAFRLRQIDLPAYALAHERAHLRHHA